MNNNQKLIEGLRGVADFLEAKPDFPDMCVLYGTILPQHIRLWLRDKSELPGIARQLGSFNKVFTDHYFELHKSFGEAIDIEISVDREQVCKKVVTWDCPDDESLLKLAQEAEAR